MSAPSPYSAPQYQPQQNPQQPPQKRTGRIIAAVVGGLGCLFVLLVAVVLIIVFAVRGGGGGSAGGEETTTPDASPEEQATALVTEYMEALAAGEAGTALELKPVYDEEEGSLLPIEAYEKALELAPVADVEVGELEVIASEPFEGEVPVSFTVGGESIEDVFPVDDYDGDGVVELQGSIATTAAGDQAEALGTTLNGAEIADGQPVYLMPGGYELAYGAEHFAPESDEPQLVGAQDGDFEWPEATLTEDGLGVFRGAVQEAVDACLEKDTLEGGCGMGEVPEKSSDGWTMKDGTVKRSITEETQRAIDTMEATPSYDEPTYVRGESVGSVETTIECTKDGQSGTCELWLGGGIGVPSVDMADPELPVTWG